MKRKSFSVVVIVIAVLALNWKEASSHVVITEFPICENPANQQNPAISGKIVVWQDNRNGNFDIYGYNLSTQTEFTICTSAGDQEYPAISGNIVVWQDNRNGNFDIYGYNLSTESEFPICTSSGDQEYPAISGNTVVWQDQRSGNWDIYAQTEFAICTNAGDQEYPAISGNIVVWEDFAIGRIYGYDLSTQTQFPIGTNTAAREHPDISGDIVVWQDRNYNIYGYDISTQREFPICINPAIQQRPTTSGNIVVWEDFRNTRSDIYAYELSTQTEFAICTNPVDLWRPAISGKIVVWFDNHSGNYDIYGASINLSDECDNAIPVQMNQAYNGSTMGATGTDVSSCADKDANDVWHSFTPDFNYEYTISLCGSAFDTTLAVFDECGGTELACNDDTELGVCPSELQSQIKIALEKDSTYFIRVAGCKYQTGDYTLNIIGPRCTVYPVMDFDKNCKVNFEDFALFTQSWLECNLDPQEACVE